MSSTQNSATKKKIGSNNGGLPCLKKDLQNSLLFLQQSGASGDSLFDHLSNVIAKVIDERPKNVVDYFEQFSERVRLENFSLNENLLEEGYKEPARLCKALRVLPALVEKLRQPISDVEDKNDGEDLVEQSPDEEEEGEIIHEAPTRDLWELQSYWNLLGIGFPREESFALACSIARLKSNPSVSSYRFWGKMWGLKNDYYIVEATLTRNDVGSEEDIGSDTVEKAAINITGSETNVEFISSLTPSDTSTNTKVKNDDDKDNGSDLRAEAEEYPTGWNFAMEVPESQYRPPVEIPAELIGNGVNRNAYFVCTDLLDEWIELPPATPHQISVSRRIKKYLSGNLDETISSYPSFPGTERSYLRALIARISAGAHISPRNFYQAGEDGEDAGNDEADDDDENEETLNNDKPIKENERYRPWPVSKSQQLDYWEHHKPEILKQGRVAYFDGSLLNDDLEDDDGLTDVSDEEDEEAEATNNDTKPEIPIPLFASCSGDQLINDGMSPWTIRLSDVSETLVFAQSHVWPGAFAFVKDRTCDNIYIGFGHKYSSANYSPPPIPEAALEFSWDEPLVDGDDPTVEQEEAAKLPQSENDNPNSDDEDKSDGEGRSLAKHQ